MRLGAFGLFLGISALLLSGPLSAQGLVDFPRHEGDRPLSKGEGRRKSRGFAKLRVEREPATRVTCYCLPTGIRSGEGPSFLLKLKEEERSRALAWQAKRSAYHARYRRLNDELQQLRQLKRACDSGGISVYWREPCGNQWSAPSWGLGASLCEAMPKAIRDTELALERLQLRAYDDARKLRIDPGLARLESYERSNEEP